MARNKPYTIQSVYNEPSEKPKIPEIGKVSDGNLIDYTRQKIDINNNTLNAIQPLLYEQEFIADGHIKIGYPVVLGADNLVSSVFGNYYPLSTDINAFYELSETSDEFLKYRAFKYLSIFKPNNVGVNLNENLYAGTEIDLSSISPSLATPDQIEKLSDNYFFVRKGFNFRIFKNTSGVITYGDNYQITGYSIFNKMIGLKGNYLLAGFDASGTSTAYSIKLRAFQFDLSTLAITIGAEVTQSLTNSDFASNSGSSFVITFNNIVAVDTDKFILITTKYDNPGGFADTEPCYQGGKIVITPTITLSSQKLNGRSGYALYANNTLITGNIEPGKLLMTGYVGGPSVSDRQYIYDVLTVDSTPNLTLSYSYSNGFGDGNYSSRYIPFGYKVYENNKVMWAIGNSSSRIMTLPNNNIVEYVAGNYTDNTDINTISTATINVSGFVFGDRSTDSTLVWVTINGIVCVAFNKSYKFAAGVTILDYAYLGLAIEDAISGAKINVKPHIKYQQCPLYDSSIQSNVTVPINISTLDFTSGSSRNIYVLKKGEIALFKEDNL